MKTSRYDVIVAVLIVVGIWALGYIAGGISVNYPRRGIASQNATKDNNRR